MSLLNLDLSKATPEQIAEAMKVLQEARKSQAERDAKAFAEKEAEFVKFASEVRKVCAERGYSPKALAMVLNPRAPRQSKAGAAEGAAAPAEGKKEAQAA